VYSADSALAHTRGTQLYLHARVWFPLYGVIVVPVLQLGCVCLAVFVALSRIHDYKHHWSDVFAGSLLGIIVACITSAAIAELWLRREKPDSYDLRAFSRVYEQPLECTIGIEHAGSLNGRVVTCAYTHTRAHVQLNELSTPNDTRRRQAAVSCSTHMIHNLKNCIIKVRCP
jgi:phosphatidate phosphatase